MSRIGKKPINIPDKVKLVFNNDSRIAIIEGSKGNLSLKLPNNIELVEEDGCINVKSKSEKKSDRAMFGTIRSLIANMVTGVNEGFEKKLEINGVGFKAAVKGNKLDLSLGYSHPILYQIPDEINIEVKDNTKISVSGIDKQKVGQVAAEIRAYYPPEPYKGKGVRYSDEIVRRKAGKSVKK